MNRLATNGHTNGKLRFSAQDWQGPNHGDRGGTYWQSKKTGEKVYSPTNPGGQESQGEEQQSGQQGAKPDLKAIGQKYAQQAREKWGDKAHENLTKIAAGLEKDESPEAQKKLAAVKAMLQAVQAEAKPEAAPSESPAEKPPEAVGNETGNVSNTPETPSEPTPGEPILQPEKQQAVNERKRSGMAPEVVQAEKKKQYLKTDRGAEEEFREQSDAEEEAKRKKEDEDHKAKKEAMDARHGDEWAAAEAKVDAVQSRRDQLEDSRNEQDAADEEARQKEDEDFADKTTAEDEALQKSRDAEDEATEAARSPIRDQLTAAWYAEEDGTPEDAKAKKAFDAAEAKWDKEDEKRDEKRGKYDDKATADYEKANEKREADREKHDEKIRKAREAEDKKLDKAESKVEAERDKLEEKHRNEIDDLDQEETDREAEREKDDDQVREDREEEDAGFDDQDEKEAEEGTELIDSFEETDDGPEKSPEEQLDAVRKYNEMAAKTGKRNRIIWYEGRAFQGWANENIDSVTDDDFDRFCPLPNESKKEPSGELPDSAEEENIHFLPPEKQRQKVSDTVVNEAKRLLADPEMLTKIGQEAGYNISGEPRDLGKEKTIPIAVLRKAIARSLGPEFAKGEVFDEAILDIWRQKKGELHANTIKAEEPEAWLKGGISGHGNEVYSQIRLKDEPRQSSMDYDGDEPQRYAEDRISLDELRRMPGPEATAYAKGVLAMLQRRPDLRKEFSLQDLAYLQMIARDVDRYAADEPNRKFSSTQFDLAGDIAKAIREMSDSIPDSDLSEDGREDKPHVTIKYGLHTSNAEDVANVVRDFGPVEITFGEVSMFPAKEPSSQRGGDQYDVVKVDIEGNRLKELNKLIADSLEYTDTHPEYKPHATLAYVKPGIGKKYVGDKRFKGMTVSFGTMTFSDLESGKTPIWLENEPIRVADYDAEETT